MIVLMSEPKIQLLSDQTIDQIAAGEVIESPASVVKELVENARDAGAKKITIETKGGGLQYIKVSDDGCGMSQEDAILCFLRFATSKIRKTQDLCHLSTMGFRGEALASISAISKVCMRTCLKKGQATLIEIHAGKIVNQEITARQPGTTFEVSSLFYNVPARKKFQKSAQSSASEITRMVFLLALSHPEISFELVQQEKEIFSVLAGSFQERIHAVLGDLFQDKGFPVEFQEEGMRIVGMIGNPEHLHRPNRSGQYLFINHRPVSSPSIAFAIKEAFGTRLDQARFPVFAFHLFLDPEKLDVNVHPQKKEVRIFEEYTLKKAIQKAIFSSLNPAPKVTPIEFSIPIAWECKEQEFSYESAPLQETLFFEPKIWGLVSFYLFLEDETGLVLVDLRAVYRRLFFDSLSQHNFPSQSLLFPPILQFSAHEYARLEEQKEHIEQMGISLKFLAANSVMIEAMHSMLTQEEAHDYLLFILEELSNPKETRERKLLRAIERASARKHFTQSEGLMLYREMIKNSLETCPQGKPLRKRITANEISQFFKTS